MTRMSYTEAVSGAFDRLKDVGFEHGPSLVNHAPMAAEALARMGLTDDVAEWLTQNLRRRRYHEAPERRWTLSHTDEESWHAALGDFSRVADWYEMFARALDEAAWSDVLTRWWPRLLPGMSGALTHGVIRTAHAVRAIATDDGPAARDELARGLGYWAARYSATGTPDAREPGAPTDPDSAETALDTLVLENAGFYAMRRPAFPVPLIHAITAPAAVRLVCEYLPVAQRWPSYLAARRTSLAIRGRFQHGAGNDTPVTRERPDADQIIGAAVETGDEHAIKLAEVAVRHHARTPDPVLFAASHTATRLIARNPF